MKRLATSLAYWILPDETECLTPHWLQKTGTLASRESLSGLRSSRECSQGLSTRTSCEVPLTQKRGTWRYKVNKQDRV